MENGVLPHGEAAAAGRSRPRARDALAAVVSTEARLVDALSTTFAEETPPAPARANAFGDPVTLERGPDAGALARGLADRAAEGLRVTLLATADELAVARVDLARVAARRLPVVFHAFCDRGGAGGQALLDLGWAVLLAAGVEDSIDLTLVARRAAEDSGTPFVVVHELSADRHVESIAPPDDALCDAFLGARAARVHRVADPAHPSHAAVGERAFSERVPFALASAMRGLEALTGRKHDVVERTTEGNAATMLVGAGALGEALLGEAERLRAAGFDVGAVRITSLRPFPGPRLIRALARAHVVTVLEPFDEPLAQSNPLTREVKAAFADALTWAPDYPGIGRLPHIHSGVVAAHDPAVGFTSSDVDAIARNMIEGDQGKRLFVVGKDPALALPRDAAAAPYAASRLAAFGRLADTSTADACAELCATVAASALALRCRARTGRGEGGEGATLDLVASREKPRGAARSHAVGLVVLDDPAAFIAHNPLARVGGGGMLAVPTRQADAEALWAELPAYAKAIAYDRRLRVVGLPAWSDPPRGDERRWLVAAAFVGVLLFAIDARAKAARAGALPLVDGSLVEREVIAALSALEAPGSLRAEAGALARRAFEAPLEVPRAAIERDVPSVRLGRHDPRASAPAPE